MMFMFILQIIWVVAIRETAADVIPPHTCFNANWWTSFDKQGWSSCNNNQRYITGFYRKENGGWSSDGIDRLEEAQCCEATPAVYEKQTGVCVDANWWISLNKRGSWSVCPTGYFLNGLFRSKGNNLGNIEQGRCCKPEHHPLTYGLCYDEDIREKFNKAGWGVCKKPGYFVVGLYRYHGKNWLYNLDKLRCCQMLGKPPPYLAKCFIKSSENLYGNLSRYGISGKLDLLQYNRPATPFYYLTTEGLQDVATGKCMNPISNTNLQVVLTDNCYGATASKWYIDHNTDCLMHRQTGLALSPWYYPRPPKAVRYVPGLSGCTTYNRVFPWCTL